MFSQGRDREHPPTCWPFGRLGNAACRRNRCACCAWQTRMRSLARQSGDPAQGTGRPRGHGADGRTCRRPVFRGRRWQRRATGWTPLSSAQRAPVPAARRLDRALLAATWRWAGRWRAACRARRPAAPPGRVVSGWRRLCLRLSRRLVWPRSSLRFLPVLVADYLAVHLAVYGALTLVLCWRLGLLRGQFPRAPSGSRARWRCSASRCSGRSGPLRGLFRAACRARAGDRGPGAGRGALSAGGCDPQRGGPAPLWRGLGAARGVPASLALAMRWISTGLFFLVIILPVIVLFFLLFGTMGGWVGRRTGLPAAGGLGLGLVLAGRSGSAFRCFKRPCRSRLTPPSGALPLGILGVRPRQRPSGHCAVVSFRKHCIPTGPASANCARHVMWGAVSGVHS